MEYAIITILAITTLWQTWRKRVWKRRALSNQLSLWQAMSTAFAQGVADNRSHKLRQAQSSEWPEVVND